MTKKMGYRYLPLLMCLPVLLLAGCGFHLRIQNIASSELKTLGVQSSDTDFAYTLKNALQNAGVTLNKNAPYQVNVLSYSVTSANQTQATANIANYMLTAKVRWTLEMASGQPLFLPRTFSQNVSYQVNNDVNISNASSGQAISELKQTMATAIVRQIGAISSDQLEQWVHQAKIRQSKKDSAQLRKTPTKKLSVAH